MNAYAQAQRGYAATSDPTRPDRTTEYDVIARITARLKRAITGQSFPDLAAALHENRQLWRTLAVDVADDGNGLPRDLRARVFYLAEFTDHHSRLVMRQEASATPLIEVNMAILRGLKHESATP